MMKLYPRVPVAFGHWLAGFTDGEGCFYIAAQKGSGHQCVFRIKLRADDRCILAAICSTTGIGYVKPVPRRGHRNPLVEWMVSNKSDCAALVKLFTRFPLRAKKSRDFAIWAEAVKVQSQVRHVANGKAIRSGWGTVRHENQPLLAELKTQLESQRRFECAV